MQKLIQITSGRGPAECTRVVARVLQIFMNEAKQHSLIVDVLQHLSGDQAGSIETVLLSIDGDKTDTFVRSWLGTVQWVGESDIRKKHKRKNWYIGVYEIDQSQSIDIKLSDISYQTMRSSGAGGQHVNKVNSAVRATHIPTGLQVVAMDTRSQHQNKLLAYDRLIQKLKSTEVKQWKEIELKTWTNKINIERGNPTRVFKGSDFKKNIVDKSFKPDRLKAKNDLKAGKYE
jgi:peptide chain release factor